MKKLILVSALLIFLFPAITFAYPVSLYDFTGDDASVLIEITGDGTSAITFDVRVLEPEFADIRGVWFNFDGFPTNSGALTVQGLNGTQIPDYSFINDSVGDLGNGNNLNGENATAQNFDAGIAIGTQGIGADDYYTASFIVSSGAGELLYLGDYFGARLTSVGDAANDREESSKLVGTVAPVPEPATMLLLGTGLIGLAGASRKKLFKK